jgi:hypothetical protein
MKKKKLGYKIVAIWLCIWVISRFVGVSHFTQKNAGGFCEIQEGQLAGTPKVFHFAFNVAEKIEGIQFGAFNFSDSCTGVPVGLLSIVRTGYHSIGFRTNELALHQVFFRTGVERFYNIFSYGTSFKNNSFYSLGYGFGNLKRYNNKWSRAWEFDFAQLKSYNSARFEFNLLSNIRLQFAYNPTEWLSIEAGPQYYHHIRNVLPPNEPYMLALYNNKHYILGDTAWTHWIGGFAGVSINF